MILIKTLNEEGYIFVFVLIVTSTLLTLGLATATISHTNFKMKQINSQGKKNFYVVEALVEESDMKLYNYVERANYHSYFSTYDDINKVCEYDKTKFELTYYEKNQIFKDVYKSEIKKMKTKLENIDEYSIKTVEGYKVTLEAELEECMEEEKFIISMISTYKDKNIIEKIKTQYNIIIPEYKDYGGNIQLVSRVKWMNYKW